MQDLKLIFPRSLESLRAHFDRQPQLLEDFVQEKLQPHWLPAFLRQQKVPPQLVELAQVEWLRYELQQAQANPLGQELVKRSLSGPLEATSVLKLSELVRWLELKNPYPEWGLEKGLLVFYFDEESRLVGRPMSPLEAFTIDALEEGLALELRQLVEWAQKEELFCQLGPAEVSRQIEKMRTDGLLKSSS